MKAGQLNRRVTIQQRSSEADDWGQPKEAWSDVCMVWAWVKAPTGMGTINSEFMAESGEVSRTLYSIRIRYRNNITAKMRCVCDGTVFDIRSVIPDIAGHKYVDLVVAEGANNG